MPEAFETCPMFMESMPFPGIDLTTLGRFKIRDPKEPKMAEDHTEAPDIGSPRELHVHIGGMHCVNCPGLIESRFRSLPQVRTAKVLYPEGCAHVTVTDPLSVAALQDAVARDGYTVSAAVPGGALPAPRVHSLRDIAEIAGALLVLAALALALQHFHAAPTRLRHQRPDELWGHFSNWPCGLGIELPCRYRRAAWWRWPAEYNQANREA